MIRIRLTGRVGIDTDDQTVDQAALGGRQALIVFAYLVVERHRVVPREELAAALWPERLPRSWEAALRLVVSKVRAVLTSFGVPATDGLTSAFGCYQVHLPDDALVDLESAVSAVRDAERALAANDLARASERAAAARAVLSRPFLPGELSDWAEHRRDSMRGSNLRALEVSTEADVRLGNPAAAVEAAEEAVALDRFRESSYRYLMAAHAAAGNRAAALKTYERCRRTLVEGLGVGPSAETEAAYVDLLLASSADPPERTGLPSHGIPNRGPASAVAMPSVLRDAAATNLVGRDRELADARSAWSLVRDGHRHVLLISGEAGMGKTALAARVAAELWGEGATVLYGCCDQEEIVPFQPYAEAIDRYVRACPTDRLQREVGRDGGDLARLVIDLPRWVPGLTLPPPAEPETERHRLFGSVAAFLHAVERSAPVVLVLDDFQWAGPATRVLLRHVTRSLEAARVFIIVCYRDDDSGAERPLEDLVADLLRERAGYRLQLQGLDENAVESIVQTAADLTVTAGLAHAIQVKTAGNPLFVIELLRHLAESAKLHYQAARSSETMLASLGVPSTVQDVFRRRCDRISKTAKGVVELAAVIGQRFEIRFLAQVSALGDEALIEALEETVRARLTNELSEAGGHYCFAHALAREAVYANISGVRRAYLHRRVGEALERGDASDSGPTTAELAYHFEAAGDRMKAVSYATRAGDHASGCLAFEAAAHHYDWALRQGLTQPDEQLQRCHVLMALATVYRKAGQVAKAREAYLEATSLARRLGDPEALAGCALGLGGGGRGVSAWIADDVRIMLLEEALDVIGAGDSDLRAKLLAELAKSLNSSPQERRRDAVADEAIAVARRLGEPGVLARALSATRMIRWGPANTELRLAYSDDVLALSEQSGDRELILRARLARIGDLVEVADRVSVDREITAALALATEVRQPYYLWCAITWDRLRAVIDGRVHDADQRAADARQVWRADMHPDARHWEAIQVATTAIQRGRAAEAVDLFRAVVETHPTIPSYRCILTLALSRAGRQAEARSLFETFASDGFLEPPIDAHWLTGASALAETSVALGDREGASVLYELLVPFADRLIVLDAFGGGAMFSGSVAYHLGMLAATIGHHAETGHHLRAAIEVSARFGARPCLARAQDAMAAWDLAQAASYVSPPPSGGGGDDDALAAVRVGGAPAVPTPVPG